MKIDCPRCGETALLGIPRDASLEDVTTETNRSVSTDVHDGTKTRKVSCPDDHQIYVTFTVTDPDHDLGS